MAFNISDYINKFKERRMVTESEDTRILRELQIFIPAISHDDVRFNKNIIFIKNISPTKKTFLKLKKRIIIKKLLASNIKVYDII